MEIEELSYPSDDDLGPDSDKENPVVISEKGKRRLPLDESFASAGVTKKVKTGIINDAEKASNLAKILNSNLTRHVKYRRVLKHIPKDVPYVPITTESGGRVYLRLKKPAEAADQSESEQVKLISTVDGSNKKLFPNWESIRLEARILKDRFHENVSQVVVDENLQIGNNNDDSLWVDKYKPHAYFDLLSEESVNKTLLHWLKTWDKYVFGSDYLEKVKLTKQKFASLEAKENESPYGYKQKQATVPDEYDEIGRPKLKVALLHGYPGLGKTTCAHIVAKHAGYSVKEMNASDDRSADIFKKVLDDMTQSRAEMFQDGRPNCLIIDEIDGAPAPAVKVLVDLVTGNAVEGGKRKLKKVLRRPVICICNDVYSPSLKDLKKISLILHFNPISVHSLSERLSSIARRERLSLDARTIRVLCEKSECDVRSCLSTMQFLKRRKCTPQDILNSQIGLKDKSKGIYSVWSDIFYIPERNRNSAVDLEKPAARFNLILRAAQSYGEYDKLVNGVFENYLRVKSKRSMEPILTCLEWTSWFQRIQMSVELEQNFILMGYLPLYFVEIHFLFAQKEWVNIQFPSNQMFKTSQNANIVKTVMSGVSPAVGRYLDPSSIINDVFPCLTGIIQPGSIRPVPTQIWSPKERETLKNIIDIMISYNLSYSQTKNESGAYNFTLEPDLDALTKFRLQEINANKKAFPYTVKQFIAREIEIERLRRHEGLPVQEGSVSDPLPPTKKSTSDNIFKTPKPKPSPVKIAPELLQKHDPTASVAKDFFGRPVFSSAQNTSDLLARKRRSTGMYFKYKEGYSNAVRKFVKMKDLI